MYDNPGPGLRERIEAIIHYAVLAPSSHNTQPWKFAAKAGSIRVSLDESRWLRVADPDQRELHISIGCALENLIRAARAFGYAPELTYFPVEDNPELVAEVQLRRNPREPRDPAPLALMESRRTSHKVFEARALPQGLDQRLEACAAGEGVQLFLTADAETRKRFEELTIQADALQFADPLFRHELGEWIGRGVFGTPWLLAKLGQFAVTYLDMGAAMGRKDAERIESAPLLGLITSSGDDRTSQLKAGRVFEAIYLTAAAEGVSLQPVSQLCEIPQLRGELAKLIPHPGLYPQQPFRLGYAEPEHAHTPRRPLEEVLCWL